ncbi:hypothetical protein [Cucumibacter marinus]|uniref:hypothetical protein n=1 Tax=Cucumibacter marinus TaxID=1121252 RepID=UPI00040BE98F|nr:hypothetical protein [Cucumibacter marinus]
MPERIATDSWWLTEAGSAFARHAALLPPAERRRARFHVGWPEPGTDGGEHHER